MKHLSILSFIFFLSSCIAQKNLHENNDLQNVSNFCLTLPEATIGDTLEIWVPNGSFKFEIKEKTEIPIEKLFQNAEHGFFAYCVFPESAPISSYKVILCPNEGLLMNVDRKGKISFQGTLKKTNDYLKASSKVYKKMRDGLFQDIYLDDTITSRHFKYFDDYQGKFQKLKRKYVKGRNVLTPIHIVEQENKAGMQFSRQEYIRRQYFQETERKELEQKLKFDHYDLLHDTILLKANSANIKNFLISNSDYRMLNYTNISDVEDLTKRQWVIYDYILNDEGTSEDVREFLLYFNLLSRLQNNIYPELTTQMLASFKERFQKSSYIPQLDQLVTNINDLYKTNLAEFKVLDKDSNIVSSVEWSNDLILIDVWATSCGPCIKSMKQLPEFHQEFPDIQIVCINVWDDFERWSSYLSDGDLEFVDHFLEYNNEFSDKYSINALPRYMLIKKGEGIIGSFADFDSVKQTAIDLK